MKSHHALKLNSSTNLAAQQTKALNGCGCDVVACADADAGSSAIIEPSAVHRGKQMRILGRAQSLSHRLFTGANIDEVGEIAEKQSRRTLVKETESEDIQHINTPRSLNMRATTSDNIVVVDVRPVLNHERSFQ
eukprot:scaffold78008_cov66-Cyclotella_meneghiniana.AAC.2